MSEKKSLDQLETSLSSNGAREILLNLFDEDSFLELDKFAQTPIVAGIGTIDGVSVCAFAQDNENNSGAMSKRGAEKIKKTYELAMKNGSPIVGFYNSNGGKIDEGAELLSAYGELTASVTKLSGVVPQISVVTGVSAGAQALVTTLADIVIMTEKAELFLTAPFVTDDSNELSGSSKISAEAGVSAINVKDNDEAIKKVKDLLAILPSNNLEPAYNVNQNKSDFTEITENLGGLDLIKAIADSENIIELYSDFGTSAKTVLGNIDVMTVAFISVNGKLTQDDTVKIAKFVSFADSFSIPVVTLIDTEGFEPSSKAEISGSVRDSARLAQVFANSTTVKISVVTGKAYSSSYIALAGKNAGIDFALAWENATISAMAPHSAAVFLYADEIANSDNPKQKEKELVESYKNKKASAFAAAESGLVDIIIRPNDTRNELAKALLSIKDKRVQNPPKKHINFVF